MIKRLTRLVSITGGLPEIAESGKSVVIIDVTKKNKVVGRGILLERCDRGSIGYFFQGDGNSNKMPLLQIYRKIIVGRFYDLGKEEYTIKINPNKRTQKRIDLVA